MNMTATHRPAVPPRRMARGPAGAPRAVSDSLTVTLDAEPNTVLSALHRVDLAAPIARALAALDLADRVVLLPAAVGEEGGGGLVLGVVWRIRPTAPEQRPGNVKVRWEVQVEPAGDRRSFLSIATRFTATDDDSYARLLDAWGLLGPLARSLARRAAGAVGALAEAEHETELAA